MHKPGTIRHVVGLIGCLYLLGMVHFGISRLAHPCPEDASYRRCNYHLLKTPKDNHFVCGSDGLWYANSCHLECAIKIAPYKSGLRAARDPKICTGKVVEVVKNDTEVGNDGKVEEPEDHGDPNSDKSEQIQNTTVA